MDDAMRDYIISHATNPARIAMGLFFLVLWIGGWIARWKHEDSCSARAVGTIVSAKDENWGFFDHLWREGPQTREIVIRFSVDGREMTVTRKEAIWVGRLVYRILFGNDEGYNRDKRPGDKVVIFYNPSNLPREYIVVYRSRSKHISPSPLAHVLYVLIVVALMLFFPG